MHHVDGHGKPARLTLHMVAVPGSSSLCRRPQFIDCMHACDMHVYRVHVHVYLCAIEIRERASELAIGRVCVRSAGLTPKPGDAVSSRDSALDKPGTWLYCRHSLLGHCSAGVRLFPVC